MPNLINVRPEQAITNYDFLDIETGVGIKRYYGAVVSGATANTDYYFLTDHTIYSAETSQARYFVYADAGYTNTHKEACYVDYELPFTFSTGQPRVLKGDSFANVPLGFYNDSGQPCSRMLNAGIKILISKATTITEVASGASIFVTHQTLAAKTSMVTPAGRSVCLVKTTIPETKIKRGDVLKVRLCINTYSSGWQASAAALYCWGTDPVNRTDFGISASSLKVISGSTNFIIDLPFKLVL